MCTFVDFSMPTQLALGSVRLQQVYAVNPLEAAPEALDDVSQSQQIGGQVEVVHPEPVAYAGLIASGLPAGPLVLVHILLAKIVAEGWLGRNAVAGA